MAIVSGPGIAERYRFGLICVLAATLFTSLGGILLRWVESASGWQILFYRSASFVLVLRGFIALRHRGNVTKAFLDVGRPGLVVALCLGVSFAAYLLAMLETTVANVVFILNTVPFFAAIMAWIVLGEPIRPAFWVAMAAALVGLGFMLGDGVVAGSLAGSLLALVACLGFCAALVAMRQRRRVDMLPAVCLAGVVTMLLAAIRIERFVLSSHDLGIAIIFGVVQLGFQFLLMTEGSRYVPAAELALISRLSVVLAPLWVWVGVDEVPGRLTLIGGSIALVAVIAYSAAGLRTRSRRAG